MTEILLNLQSCAAAERKPTCLELVQYRGENRIENDVDNSATYIVTQPVSRLCSRIIIHSLTSGGPLQIIAKKTRCPQGNLIRPRMEESLLPQRLLVNAQGNVHDHVYDSNCRESTSMSWICLPETSKTLNAKQYSFRVKVVNV